MDKPAILLEATTKESEDPKYQPSLTTVSILHEQIPHMIKLLPEQTEAEFIWITIVQKNSSNIQEKFQKMHEMKNDLLKMHTNEWQQFWVENKITAKGNEQLSNAIQASIYALVASLPSLNTSEPRSRFYGLSPAGLGLDRHQEVYNGHSFWDTEMWMQPSILLLEPVWSRELLSYRHAMRNTAHDNAIKTGYNGYRFELV